MSSYSPGSEPVAEGAIFMPFIAHFKAFLLEDQAVFLGHSGPDSAGELSLQETEGRRRGSPSFSEVNLSLLHPSRAGVAKLRLRSHVRLFHTCYVAPGRAAGEAKGRH
ncbi:UNVERIFIED_CONTAM: hypothetical protein K2H54_051921, partial [Gekko kuhli]